MLARTILLVEDDENDIYFLRRAMKLANVAHPLEVVQDGQQALEYLQGDGAFVDRKPLPPPLLVLLDLQLPSLRGLDVLKWIRTQPQFATLNVIVLTSSREDVDIDAAYRLGANAYLVKPPDAAQLLETVKAIRDFWLELNQPPPALATNPARA